MGKSAAADHFRHRGIAVCDAGETDDQHLAALDIAFLRSMAGASALTLWKRRITL